MLARESTLKRRRPRRATCSGSV